MTLGYWAPLPPARTGVAEYAALLLDALRSRMPVAVNSDGDVNLYHVGNNQLHREIYRRALERPGVAVLHDAVLHHFLLGCLTRDAYVDEFTYNYGEWNRALAIELWDRRSRSAQDPRYFEHAMVRRIAERSLAVIVHNPGAAAIVRAHAPDANVVEAPHLYRDSGVSWWKVERLRAEWGARYVFGVYGHLRESKRLPICLRAFRSLSSSNAALLLAGEFVSEDLERYANPLLRGLRVIRYGRTDVEQFDLLCASADACLNLRYPAAGETSGITMRAMGAGKPVILTANAENSSFPDGSCLRVDTGLAEREMLSEYMSHLMQNPVTGREIGRQGRTHVLRHHSVEAVASKFLEALNSVR